MNTRALALLSVLAACGSDDDHGDATIATDVIETADTSACGTCPSPKLCCPSRFEGDIARCIDPALNPENCGSCGTFCAGACSDRKCVAAPDCASGTCPEGLSCASETQGRCCPAGTTFIASPADFFGCCPDGDICGCREGNCPISVRAAKKDIRYLGPDELAALGHELLATRLATYEYRADPSGRRQLGFIIDDGVPTHGIASDAHHVDLYGYVSLAVATLQVQAEQIRILREEVETLKRTLKTR